MIVLLMWLGLAMGAFAGELPPLQNSQDVPLPIPELGERDAPQWHFRTEPIVLQSSEASVPPFSSRIEAGLGAQHLLRFHDEREVAGLASRLTAELTGGPRWFRQQLGAEAVFTPSDDPASDRFSGETRLFQFGRGSTVFQGARLHLGWRGLVNTQLALSADSVATQGGWGIRASVAGNEPLADAHELFWKAAGQMRQESRPWWGGQVEAADRMTLDQTTLIAGLGLESLGEHVLPYPVWELNWPFWADTRLRVQSVSTLEAPFLTLYQERVAPLIRQDLRPEKGWGGQIHIDRRFSPTVTLGLGVLGQGVADWIYWQPEGTGWRPANSTELASRVGVTAQVDTRWSEAVTQRWGYRLRYGLIKSLRQGEHQLESHLSWRWPDLPLAGDLGLRMQAFDLESRRPLYLLLDGSVSYHVTETIAVTLRAENWQLTALEPDAGWWEPMQLLSVGAVAHF